MAMVFAFYIAVCLVPIWVYYIMQVYSMPEGARRIFDYVFLCRLICSVLVHGYMHLLFGLRYRFFIREKRKFTGLTRRNRVTIALVDFVWALNLLNSFNTSVLFSLDLQDWIHLEDNLTYQIFMQPV